VRLWVKVCGLTSEAALGAALAAGVDAVGFVFHAGSPRNLTPARAAALAAAVPRAVSRVAVTRHPTQQLIDAIVAQFVPDALQTDLEDLATLRLPESLARLPVLRSGWPGTEPLPPRCLFESADSGRGRRADWPQATALAVRTELVLAGGLDPGNVAAAVATVRPFGVDVSSGVESAPGVKDVALIHKFVAAARAAAQADAVGELSG
jgi:phosphoribosylanthranilate isomerase